MGTWGLKIGGPLIHGQSESYPVVQPDGLKPSYLDVQPDDLFIKGGGRTYVCFYSSQINLAQQDFCSGQRFAVWQKSNLAT